MIYVDDATLEPVKTVLEVVPRARGASPRLYFRGLDGSLWRYMGATRTVTYVRLVAAR